MARPSTHEGILVGCDNRSPDGWRRRVRLYATTRWWVTESGRRYSRETGLPVPHERYPLMRLDLAGVHVLERGRT